MTTRRANRRVIATTAIASIVAGLILAAFGVATAPAGATPPTKVVICHATSAKTNPYQESEINPNALDGDGGHDHTGHTGPVFDFGNPAANARWGDIIPPFGTFPGLNWDADGQVVHGAHCAPVQLDLCEFDLELTADDPACTAPVEPGVCELDPELTVDDPGCAAPVEPEVCEFDAELTADDPGCAAPVEPEVCEFDPDLSADDPMCAPQVGDLNVTPPAATPPSGDAGSPDAGSPDAAPPSDGGSARDEVVASDTVAGGMLPRTGGAHGSLVTAALILILLGVCTLGAQRVTHPRRRGGHFLS